jgi:caa(3)-type oxidase subunit IV
MNISLNRFATLIWLALVILTVLTFLIGEEVNAGKTVMLSVLAISLIKGQLIANYFMGLRHVSWLWRGIILGYFVIVGGMIAIAYLN